MTLSHKAALGALCVVLLLGGHSCMQRREIARLEASLRASEQTVSALRKSVSAQYSELAVRREETETLAEARAEKESEYAKIKEADPEACSWSVAPLPDSVRAFLCESP